METDICECKRRRDQHGKLADSKPGVSFCVAFRLDRKATWNAERGEKRPRMCLLLTGCRICGAPGEVTYRKTEKGELFHDGCPGPRPTPVRSRSFTMPTRGA